MTDLQSLYRELYELTAPLCGSCRVPYACCDAVLGCELTQKFAKDFYQIDLEPCANPKNELLFLGSNGCTVEPYLRPHCTRHQCDVNNCGSLKDPILNQRYFDLIDMIQRLEYNLYLEKRK